MKIKILGKISLSFGPLFLHFFIMLIIGLNSNLSGQNVPMLIGDVEYDTKNKAIVYLNTEVSDPKTGELLEGHCTGTFIHPYFILSAAHCLPKCKKDGDEACYTGNIMKAEMWTGTNGTPVNMYATDGTLYKKGNRYDIDYVFFPNASHWDGNGIPDVVILRTVQPFQGKTIPVMESQDLPNPINVCRRYEFTWPYLAGFSNNNQSTSRSRRIGRAEVKCQVEMNGTAFTIDAAGDTGPAAKVCIGDSGGPVLWKDGFGRFMVGGVISYGGIEEDELCPNLKGENGIAFIPIKFLDEVATLNYDCEWKEWEYCSGADSPYDGHMLEHLGTEIIQCNEREVFVEQIEDFISIKKGETTWVQIFDKRFRWYCGDTELFTHIPSGTQLIIIRRSLSQDEAKLECYRFLD